VWIERATLRELRLRLREPFRTSRGVVQERSIVLVTLGADGLEGWGECVAGVDPSSGETVDGAWRVLEGALLPRALGRALDRPGEVVAPSPPQHPMAAAAVEMAAWDLAARMEGVSLSHELGGAGTSIAVGVSVGLQPSAVRLVEVVAGYVADGYARVKVKIEPGRDVEMLATLRERFPDLRLWADANAAYTLADVVRLRELDRVGLELLEQPLPADDLDGHARLRRELSTPVCLDESIASEKAARRAIELGACEIMNLKPGRLGGHAATVRIHDLARSRGVPVWCGGMLESGIGRAHDVALASLPGFTLPGDISASRRYWERDIVDPGLELVDGRMAIPAGAGIGVEIDRDYLRELTVRETALAAPPQARAGRMHQGQ
jgi:O-succinylbenzoate synthase